MNSLEASRVLSVCDEALEGLRLLSCITPEVLDTAEQLKDMVGEDLVHCMVKHRALASNVKGSISSDQLVSSSWELWRLLKKSPSAHRLQFLASDRSAGIMQVIQMFEKLRQFAQKRLTTTVEEDNSNRDYFEEVKEREEKAVSEKLQLEQKLRLQRVELTKQMNIMQSSEDKARTEYHDIQTSASHQKSGLQDRAKQNRTADNNEFSSESEHLTKELEAAKQQLAKLKEENREAEALLRKNKKRAGQDVETVIGEYDRNVGAKEAEYNKAHSEYQELLTQLEEYTKGYNAMKKEREEYEEQERKNAEMRFQEAVKNLRLNHAARVIQKNWRAHKARIEAEKKAAKKKGKGKGRSKSPGKK